MSQPNNRRPIITEINPKSHISESYRMLRTNIQFSMIDKKIQSVMVTSAEPGEGKTTTALNLAVTYAQSGQKVVIVDCDLRKPTVHYSFMVSNRLGVTSLLSNQAGMDQIIQPCSVENLSVITSGPLPPNPAEMLASQRMSTFLEELESRFDIIVIDTPPALAVTDSQIIASKCDGVILVIDSGKVKREKALRVKNSLLHVKANILGVVLNNMGKNNKDGYYNYYYYYGTSSKG